MKGGNSDDKNDTTPKKTNWATLILMTSFIVLYVLTAVFLFLQYKGLEDLKFRVAILEKEHVLFEVGLTDDDLKSKVLQDKTFDWCLTKKHFHFRHFCRRYLSRRLSSAMLMCVRVIHRTMHFFSKY